MNNANNEDNGISEDADWSARSMAWIVAALVVVSILGCLASTVAQHLFGKH